MQNWKEVDLFLVGVFQSLELPVGYHFGKQRDTIKQFIQKVVEQTRKETLEEVEKPIEIDVDQMDIVITDWGMFLAGIDHGREQILNNLKNL